MKDLSPVGDLLGRLMEGLGIARPTDVTVLVERWEAIAGEPWASRSRPINLANGELVVEACDGSAAALLRYQTNLLIERIDLELGRGLVQRVRLRTARRPFTAGE